MGVGGESFPSLAEVQRQREHLWPSSSGGAGRGGYGHEGYLCPGRVGRVAVNQEALARSK